MSVPRGDYRSPDRREHFVYRYFDQAGRLLYVGCSMRPERRWKEHRTDRRVMTRKVKTCRMQGPYTYETARAIERAALATEGPEYGWTPQRRASANRRNAWVSRRSSELIEGGMAWPRALEKAGAEADRRGLAKAVAA